MTDEIRMSTEEDIKQYSPATPEETQQDIDSINEARDDRAAMALKELTIAVVSAVTDIDNKYGVHEFLVDLKIVCEGPGSFRLDITDKNSQINPQSVAKAAADHINKHANGGYYKPARSIAMEINNHAPESTEGPDDVPS